MSISRQEWAGKILAPVSHPVEFIPVVRNSESPNADVWDLGCSSLKATRGWLSYSANAVVTAGARLGVPVGYSCFAVKGARARKAAIPEVCMAAGVGLAVGTVAGVVGLGVNIVQVGMGACMAGASAVVTNYRFAQRSIASFEPQQGVQL